MKDKKSLAIVGMGPRGLYALENFILQLRQVNDPERIHIFLFEETGNFGNGQVYDLKQIESNWVNISERILHLDTRVEIKLGKVLIPSFPSYHDWADKNLSDLPKKQADTYPPRSKIGAYLNQRFQTLIDSLMQADIVSLYTEQVKEVTIKQDKVSIRTNARTLESIDEVLLTIGHQPTKISEQLSEWEKFDADNANTTLFKSSYPISRILNCEKLSSESTIGIRGFGLAMIDVMRAIASKFGDFVMVDQTTQALKYQSSYDLSNLLVPFSLDGLPPVPKPLNAEIDDWYKPRDEQLSAFESAIENPLTQKEASSSLFLIDAIVPIVAKIYLRSSLAGSDCKLSLATLEKISRNWLEDAEYQHSAITPKKQPIEKMMQEFVGMATGKKAVSLDFCIGQVWRHCQPSIYKKLSYSECSEAVIAKIIALDERMKRYAYGPPVESIQQILALAKAGVINLELLNDPEIKLKAEGWYLKSGENSITVDLMVNSVLDAPKIKAVDSPIIKNLLSDDLIQVVHDDLGVATGEDAYIISKNEHQAVPIALLGRLAKGTVIGVDAILECFGDRPQQWAKEAAKRYTDSFQLSSE